MRATALYAQRTAVGANAATAFSAANDILKKGAVLCRSSKKAFFLPCSGRKNAFPFGKNHSAGR